MEQRVRCHVCATEADFVDAAARAIAACAEQSLARAARFNIVLAGGTTPRPVYRALRDIATDWSAWHIYFGDERCLPTGDSARNDTMVMSAWLDHVPIPAAQIHSIDAHLGADTAADKYAEVLAGIVEFDLVLLGLGEDGHTASLFPGHGPGMDTEAALVLAVNDAPKPPRSRVTLSSNRLSRAHRVVFLITGESKREAARRWRAGEDIPARHIAPAAGIDVYITAVAAPNED